MEDENAATFSGDSRGRKYYSRNRGSPGHVLYEKLSRLRLGRHHGLLVPEPWPQAFLPSWRTFPLRRFTTLSLTPASGDAAVPASCSLNS